MESKTVYAIVVSVILSSALGFGLSYAILHPQIQGLEAELNAANSRFEGQTIHTFTLYWGLEHIPPGSCLGGYVHNWTVPEAIRILQVEVWMGNPFDIKWEGDVIVALNNAVEPSMNIGGIPAPRHLWHPTSPDEVLIHYQFDSHAPSPLPHLLPFDLRPGFHVDSGETLHVYRLFNSFDEKETYSGDGWVVFYYVEVE